MRACVVVAWAYTHVEKAIFKTADEHERDAAAPIRPIGCRITSITRLMAYGKIGFCISPCPQRLSPLTTTRRRPASMKITLH